MLRRAYMVELSASVRPRRFRVLGFYGAQQVGYYDVFRASETIWKNNYCQYAEGTCRRVAPRFCPQCDTYLCAAHSRNGKCAQCQFGGVWCSVWLSKHDDAMAVVSVNFAKKHGIAWRTVALARPPKAHESCPTAVTGAQRKALSVLGKRGTRAVSQQIQPDPPSPVGGGEGEH